MKKFIIFGSILLASSLLVEAQSLLERASGSSSSSGAPATSTFITQTPDAGLSGEQALSLLATGILKVTTTTGALTTAVIGDFPALDQYVTPSTSGNVLTSNGSAWTSAASTSCGVPTVLAKTANYTVATSDGCTSTGVTIEATSGTFTVTLYVTASNAGRKVIVKNSGTGVVTIDADGTETIDGALTLTLAQYDAFTIQVNAAGTAWMIIS